MEDRVRELPIRRQIGKTERFRFRREATSMSTLF
jgi:hypothetical protein